MTQPYPYLTSQVEGAFGNASDEEGLVDLIEQLECYRELAPRVLEELRQLAHRGDPGECHALVAGYAHRSFADRAEAVEWVRKLDRSLAAWQREQRPDPSAHS